MNPLAPLFWFPPIRRPFTTTADEFPLTSTETSTMVIRTLAPSAPTGVSCVIDGTSAHYLEIYVSVHGASDRVRSISCPGTETEVGTSTVRRSGPSTSLIDWPRSRDEVSYLGDIVSRPVDFCCPKPDFSAGAGLRHDRETGSCCIIANGHLYLLTRA